MRRKQFFSNIGTIIKFGFVGTLMCFLFYSLMLSGALRTGWITKYDPVSDSQVSLYGSMGWFEVLTICALLCSSDIVAALSVVKYPE
jgi:hypothetical protein